MKHPFCLPWRLLIITVSTLMIISACAAAKATPTPTPIPPTATPIPPTNTVTPPTATPKPTATSWPTLPPNMPYPSGRAYAPIVYSPKADRALMFNGTTVNNLGGSSNEAWLFDPQSLIWKKAQNIPNGCEWYDPGGVYDSTADRVLVYCSSYGGKLFEYDFAADTWSDRKSTNTPRGAYITRIAYDAESQKTILVGGISFTTAKEQFDETWAYDYTTNAWTKMNPKTQPPGLYQHTLTYDLESDRVILWGGRTWTGDWKGGNWTSWPPDNLVWAYDYNTDTWESLPVTDGPSVDNIGSDFLQYIASVYVPSVDRIFFYWGINLYAYDYNHNAWEIASKEEDVYSSVGYRKCHGMAYLSSLQRVFVFGGAAMDDFTFPEDTWLYDPQTSEWTKARP
jgi:hypothetical protein